MGKQTLATVLEPLYAAALEPDRLEDFCKAMCAATGSHVGTVMAHDAGHAGGRIDLMLGADAATMHAYEAEFARDNIWVQRTRHLMRAGAALDSDDAAPRGELRRSRYYNEFLRRIDVEQSLALCAHADADGVVLATLSRSGRLKPFGAAALALARQVAPHWANVWGIQRQLSWLRQRVQQLESALDASPVAMLTLDGRGRVLRGNAAADALLSTGTLLRLVDGRPEASRDPATLRQAVQEATAGADGDPARRRPGRTVLRDAAGRGAMVARTHPLHAIATGRAAAVLFVQPVGGERPGLADALRDLFGLTRSEAAFAAALHAAGGTSEAAAACGITPATAQARLKLIYDKTGERGLPALVRLLCAVAAATHAEPPPA